MRDYTPRHFDAARRELTLDFILHDAGPATAWAQQVKIGDQLGIGGPRGSQVVADVFDWYLLLGDETAMPAIGRRLEELSDDVRAIVLIEVDDEQDALRSPAAPRWMSGMCIDAVPHQGLRRCWTTRCTPSIGRPVRVLCTSLVKPV